MAAALVSAHVNTLPAAPAGVHGSVGGGAAEPSALEPSGVVPRGKGLWGCGSSAGWLDWPGSCLCWKPPSTKLWLLCLVTHLVTK